MDWRCSFSCIWRSLLSTYSAPNLIVQEIQSVAGKLDPLREFSHICRRELESLRSDL